MEPKKHSWLLSALLWPNLAVAIVVLVLILSGQIRNLRDLAHVLAYALTYANIVSFLAVLVMVRIAKRFSLRTLPLGPMLALCILGVIPAGCLLVQALLMAVGVVVPQHFWHEYLTTLRISMPLAAVFSLGAFAHSSLRVKLEITEQKLREKELEEERARKLAVEARLQSLEARIRPHFLFNTLNAISSLIASDPARAEQMVGRLANLLRTSLDTSNRPLISLREELQIVQSYVDIERARFGDKLQATFNVPPDLQEAKVPPMSVQVLVENAVKHGISSQPAGGEIRIAASGEDGSLRINISDTGPGFELKAVPPGHGLENLVERLSALFGEKARLNATRRDGHCEVEMVVPCL